MEGRIMQRFVKALALAIVALPAATQAQVPDTILYGVAYYDEYTPVDRVDEDARMMKAAGISVVRIAESTWGTLEPQPGVFDFSHVDRMLDAMHRQGIKVIVGTPTYAMPTWLARQHPNVLVVHPDGSTRAIWRPAEHGHHRSRLPCCGRAGDRRAGGPCEGSSCGDRLPARQRDQGL